jgi:hypothetical protein
MKPLVSLSKKQTGPLGLTNPGSDLIKSLDKNLLGIDGLQKLFVKIASQATLSQTLKY